MAQVPAPENMLLQARIRRGEGGSQVRKPPISWRQCGFQPQKAVCSLSDHPLESPGIETLTRKENSIQIIRPAGLVRHGKEQEPTSLQIMRSSKQRQGPLLLVISRAMIVGVIALQWYLPAPHASRVCLRLERFQECELSMESVAT